MLINIFKREMPAEETWKAVGFREADPKCFTNPRCSPHPSRVMWQRSRRLESSPDGYYQDGLVLIQLREEKDKESVSALLRKGRKLPLKSRPVRKGPQKLPRSGQIPDTPVPEKEHGMQYATGQTVLMALWLGTGR